jgi:hypothetical protein
MPQVVWESKMRASGFHRQVPKGLNAALVAGAFAALLFTAVGAATTPVAEWFLASSPDVTQIVDPQKEAQEPAAAVQADEARSRKCKYCGTIESIRQVGPIHEVTVRLGDRSTHVFSEANPAAWRPGERIILIGGGPSPRR